MLYIALGIAGSGLILLSALGGIFGHELDHDTDGGIHFDGDHDFGADVNADFDVDADIDVDVDADVDGIDLGTVGGHDHGDDFHGIADAIHGGTDTVVSKVGAMDNTGFSVWLPFFSLRFWIYGSAVFGVVGALLTMFKASIEPATFYYALVTGLFMGTLAATAFRYLKKQEISEGARLKDLMGKTAEVLVAIDDGAAGKIRLRHETGTIDMLALSESGNHIDSGEEVFVVAVENGQAKVVKRGELIDK